MFDIFQGIYPFMNLHILFFSNVPSIRHSFSDITHI